jgi:flagellar biosynthesis/type III secretory pathway protein FliH
MIWQLFERRNEMTAITFDTLQFVQTLTESGFEQKQAEGMAKALRKAQEETETATKRDLKELELVLKAEMQAMEYRMTIKLGAMMGGSIALVAAIIKLMEHV